MRKFFRCTFLLLLCLPVTGCLYNATKVTPEGQKVRIKTSVNESQCEYIDIVTGSESVGWNEAVEAESAMNKLRNKAAKKGGDTVVLMFNKGTFGGGSVFTGTVYYCGY